MLTFSAKDTIDLLPYNKLIVALRDMFSSGANAPLRHHHILSKDGDEVSTLLLMPAWSFKDGLGGVKLVNVNPINNARNLPSISSNYLLFDIETGRHLCFMDGGIMTPRRTAAASALAAGYLARPDSSCLLVVGAGAVGSQLPGAFKEMLPIKKVLVWSRREESRNELVEKLNSDGWDAEIPGSLQEGVEVADVISCATHSREPIIQGEWLRAGQHIDLIGSFTPTMREVDDGVMKRAKIFVDTKAAIVECGELMIPLEKGVINRQDIGATFYQLCTEDRKWRSREDVTLFKGVGHAVEDLAAAILVYQTANQRNKA